MGSGRPVRRCCIAQTHKCCCDVAAVRVVVCVCVVCSLLRGATGCIPMQGGLRAIVSEGDLWCYLVLTVGCISALGSQDDTTSPHGLSVISVECARCTRHRTVNLIVQVLSYRYYGNTALEELVLKCRFRNYLVEDEFCNL